MPHFQYDVFWRNLAKGDGGSRGTGHCSRIKKFVVSRSSDTARRVNSAGSRLREKWFNSLEATILSCHPYPMSTSLHNHPAPEHIEFELTPEQTEVLLRTAPSGQCTLELEPLPIEVLTDGELLWLPESQVTPPVRETIALESDAGPIPMSQERSLGRHEQSTKPLRTGWVGLVVRVLLHVGLLVGIAYARQTGEEPIQAAQKVDPKPAGTAGAHSGARVWSKAT